MSIVVNGQERTLGEGATIAELLRELGLERVACAVEVNKRLVRKAQHPEAKLAPGDRVEIVTLVGGG